MKKTIIVAVLMISVVIIFSSLMDKKQTYNPQQHADVKPDITSVMTFLKGQDYTTNQSWHLFPEKNLPASGIKRLGLPVHGRWVRTFVNQIAFDYLNMAEDPAITQPLEFPPGSFIVKENYHSKFSGASISSKNDTLGVITLLYKPDSKYNYCATPNIEPYNAVDCLGGDWFYGFFFAAEMNGLSFPPPLKKTSDSVNLHINAFCVNCHAPAFKTDYVRTLDNIRNPFKMGSKSPYCAPFQANFVSEKNKIPTSTPSNLSQFKADINKYITDTDLSPNLPGDVPQDPTLVFNEMGGAVAQSMFDSYAWKSFIAICWPNKTPLSEENQRRGDPDTKAPFTNNIKDPMVWETYKPTFEVFQPGDISWNPVNQNWNSPVPKFAENSCNPDDDYQFVITMSSKTRDVVNETGQAFAGSFGYLVDQDNKRVRYEVLLNRTEFEYLIGDGRAATLNLTPGGPKGMINKVHFPDTRNDTLYGQGSMEIKSAWKELCLDDSCNQQDAKNLDGARKRFLVRKALIYDEETKSCRTAQMALVGLHIARKTYFAPQWIWMTFEHKDNVPDANVNPEEAKGIFYSAERAKAADSLDCSQWPFLFPKAEIINCPNVDLNRFMDGLKMAPNQLTRLVPIDSVAQKFNTAFQAELKKIDSPFANYILVNTQWALNGRQQNKTVSKLNCEDNGLDTDCFKMIPSYLRNSVIESYMATYCEVKAKPMQVSNRSCMSCHGTAGADMSFVFLDAVSQRIKLAKSVIEPSLKDDVFKVKFKQK
jgi:hypothetical protein